MQPQCGQPGSPPLLDQRNLMKTFSTFSSSMRATDASESVLAAAKRRKCCGIRHVDGDYANICNAAICRKMAEALPYGRMQHGEYTMAVESDRIDAGDGEAAISEKTKRFVKAELKRADVTYDELARRLSKMGVRETKVSIASKLSRGAFSATFFVAVMKALDRRTLSLEEI
jgi:hypothetical protein